MTYIQPSRKTLTAKILPVLIAMAVLAALWLVGLYNNTVDLEHGIIGMRGEIKALQAENAELKERVFALFDAEKAINGLVQDKNPEYFEAGPEKNGGLGFRY